MINEEPLTNLSGLGTVKGGKGGRYSLGVHCFSCGGEIEAERRRLHSCYCGAGYNEEDDDENLKIININDL